MVTERSAFSILAERSTGVNVNTPVVLSYAIPELAAGAAVATDKSPRPIPVAEIVNALERPVPIPLEVALVVSAIPAPAIISIASSPSG